MYFSLKHLRVLAVFVTFLLIMFVQLIIYKPEEPVEGWEPHLSRDMRRYVLPDQTTALIPQPGLCGQQLFLLVVVCSAVNHFQQRAAIRDTWSASTSSGRVAFLLGDTNNATLQARISEESARHGDVIQEDFLDSYNNLTIKSVMLLKWVRTYCPMARFIMKSDDDMFVNVDKLVRLLLRYEMEPNLLLGKLVHNFIPSRWRNSKWYCPRYMYSANKYPDYLSGPGYVMSAAVLNRLYEEALSTPFFHLEDVFLTGICALRAGIRPRHHPGFTYERMFLSLSAARKESIISIHNVGPETIRKLWVCLLNSSLHC